MSVPRPLPAGSRKLRDHRVHVRISSRVPAKFDPSKTAQRVHTEGRFVTTAEARLWAEAVRRPGERASLTFYAAADGWLSHAGPTLTDAGWDR